MNSDYDRLVQAIFFMRMAHGETASDKGGQPFIGHPLRVMARLASPHAPVELLIAALLHDVIEDTSVDLADINIEFGREVADAVDFLTRYKTETYREYIRRCVKNPLARLVKQADIEDNSDP